MEKIKNIIWPLLLLAILFTACEDYLDVPPEADLTEEDIFSTYQNFQGFQDQLYSMISDYNGHAICVSANFLGETVSPTTWNSANMGCRGDYWSLVNDAGNRSIFRGYNEGTNVDQNGAYDYWPVGCRIANLCLENLDKGMLLKGNEKLSVEQATNLLRGQAYFFRAYFHFDIVRSFGSIPYLDKVFSPEELDMPRYWSYTAEDGNTYKNTQAVFIRMAEDCDKAAALLPATYESEKLRATKGAAYALKAKALLYAASPLFNEDGGNSETFNKDLCEKAAVAANEVFKLNQYSLAAMDPSLTPDNNLFLNVMPNDLDYNRYSRMFFTREAGTHPYNEEVILCNAGGGNSNLTLNRLYTPAVIWGNGVCEAPSQNFVDNFEMEDGTRYKPGSSNDGGYDGDFDKIYNSRDRRFRASIRVHNDVCGSKKKLTLDLSKDGKHNTVDIISPYFVRKFWPDGADKFNNETSNFRMATPALRLADIYLIYAEAVFEAYGDANKTAPGASLTAVQAINQVRQRAGQPDVDANPAAYSTILEGHGELSSDHPFRLLVRNERNVELCFEGNYWWDMRRWKRAHLLDKTLYKLDFDKNYTDATRSESTKLVFESRHYWLPWPKDITQLSEKWPQNPGW